MRVTSGAKLSNNRIDYAKVRIVHNSDVVIGAMASQITSLMIIYSTVYSGVYERKHQSPASPAFVRGIHL